MILSTETVTPQMPKQRSRSFNAAGEPQGEAKSGETMKDLEARGHKVTGKGPPLWAPTLLSIDPVTRVIHAAGDPKARRHAGAF